jgi:hypothetical protein
MSENTIYLWTDRQEHAYAQLQRWASHWRVEWGYRDPPGSDVFLPRAKHETSVRAEAVRWLLDRVRAISTEPGEVEQLEARLRAALAEAGAGPPPHRHR